MSQPPIEHYADGWNDQTWDTQEVVDQLQNVEPLYLATLGQSANSIQHLLPADLLESWDVNPQNVDWEFVATVMEGEE